MPETHPKVKGPLAKQGDVVEFVADNGTHPALVHTAHEDGVVDLVVFDGHDPGIRFGVVHSDKLPDAVKRARFRQLHGVPDDENDAAPAYDDYDPDADEVLTGTWRKR